MASGKKCTLLHAFCIVCKADFHGLRNTSSGDGIDRTADFSLICKACLFQLSPVFVHSLIEGVMSRSVVYSAITLSNINSINGNDKHHVTFPCSLCAVCRSVIWLSQLCMLIDIRTQSYSIFFFFFIFFFSQTTFELNLRVLDAYLDCGEKRKTNLVAYCCSFLKK